MSCQGDFRVFMSQCFFPESEEMKEVLNGKKTDWNYLKNLKIVYLSGSDDEILWSWERRLRHIDTLLVYFALKTLML